MTIRFYVLPLVQITGHTNFWGPKYFVNGGLADPYALIDYGLTRYCILCTDITPQDHTTLSANADVLSIPVNIDNTLTAGAVTTAKNFLEGFNIPANWINAGDTYRSVLRTVTGMFQFMQRLTAILGREIDFTSVSLSAQFGNFPADIKAALLQAAQELNYDISGVTATTTLRQILKLAADDWGATPIFFGSLATL